MTAIRPGTIAALLLAVAALAILAYSLFITPEMNRGNEGARAPIQDTPASSGQGKESLVDSNVPPATSQRDKRPE
jgi:hypothetical protein